MTRVAAEYYRELASRHGVQLPSLLASGQSELWHAEPVFVHTLRAGRAGSEVSKSRLNPFYRDFMNTMNMPMGFSSAIARKEHPGARGVVPWLGLPWVALRHLLPGRLMTGQLFDFRIEALAPQEIPSREREELDRMRYARQYRPSESSEEVYFVLTAGLRAGARAGRMACAGVIYVPCERDASGAVVSLPMTPRILGIQLPESAVFGESILEDSRAIATAVQEHAASQPPLPGSYGSRQ